MNCTLTQRCISVALCVLLSGCCSLCQLAARTAVREPGKFSLKKDKRRSFAVYHKWAEQAMQEEWQGCPALWDSADYRTGFSDGFVDFVYGGGTGEPPPVPPREFWNVDLRSAGGSMRANQWFEGYRHGARVAREGGYRELSAVQSSFYATTADEPYGDQADEPYGREYDAQSFGGENELSWPAPEEMPSPRDSIDLPPANRSIQMRPGKAVPSQELIEELERPETLETPETPSESEAPSEFETPSEPEELSLPPEVESLDSTDDLSRWRKAGSGPTGQPQPSQKLTIARRMSQTDHRRADQRQAGSPANYDRSAGPSSAQRSFDSEMFQW